MSEAGISIEIIDHITRRAKRSPIRRARSDSFARVIRSNSIVRWNKGRWLIEATSFQREQNAKPDHC